MGDASDEIDFENLIDLFESSFLEDDTTGFNDEKNEKKSKVHSICNININIHMILNAYFKKKLRLEIVFNSFSG